MNRHRRRLFAAILHLALFLYSATALAIFEQLRVTGGGGRRLSAEWTGPGSTTIPAGTLFRASPRAQRMILATDTMVSSGQRIPLDTFCVDGGVPRYPSSTDLYSAVDPATHPAAVRRVLNRAMTVIRDARSRGEEAAIPGLVWETTRVRPLVGDPQRLAEIADVHLFVREGYGADVAALSLPEGATSIEALRANMQAWERQNPGSRTLPIVQRSASLSHAVFRLTPAVGRLYLVHSIPRSVAEAQLIHGSTSNVSGTTDAGWTQLRSTIPSNGPRTTVIDLWSVADPQTVAVRLAAELQSAGEGDLVIVQGHIENSSSGGDIVMAQGFRVSVAEFRRVFARRDREHGNPTVWLAGCHTAACERPTGEDAALASTRPITYEESIEVLSSAKHTVEGSSDANQQEVLRGLRAMPWFRDNTAIIGNLVRRVLELWERV